MSHDPLKEPPREREVEELRAPPDLRNIDEFISSREARDVALMTARHNLKARLQACAEDVAQEALIEFRRSARRAKVTTPMALLRTIAKRRAWAWNREDDGQECVQGELRREAAQSHKETAAAQDAYPTRETFVRMSGLSFLVIQFFVQSGKPGCAELAKQFLADALWREVATAQGRKPAATRKQWERCLAGLRQAVQGLPEFHFLRFCRDV